MVTLRPLAPFDTAFYEVAATVLPVLFLALMLEGGALARIAVRGAELQARDVRALRATAAQAADRQRAESGERVVVIAFSSRACGLLTLPALASLVLFMLGEGAAILALDARRATGVEHGFTLVALLVLTGLLGVSAAAIVADAARRAVRASADS